jgi:hypothetical protein
VHAWAKLVSQQQGASTQRTRNSSQAQSAPQALQAGRMRDVLVAVAERTAPSMTSQDETMTVWALAELGMPRASSLRDLLWATAEYVVPCMISQNVATMVWALAKLDMPPGSILCNTLCKPAELVAPSMNLQDVDVAVWALATLDTLTTSSLRVALKAATNNQ